jgi:hypothetical protein
MTFR